MLFDEKKCRVCGCTDNHACPGGCYWVEADLCSRCAEKATMEGTGLLDRSGAEICIGHVTELTLGDSSIRRFKVKKKTVIREVVNLDGFINGTSKVAITGIVFEWNGHNLFPCVDETGRPDNEKMIIIGTHDET